MTAHTKRVASLVRRYQDQGISLADACIIRMSELSADCLLLTLDGGFRIYVATAVKRYRCRYRPNSDRARVIRVRR
ncbi:MAG: hypothetical protein IH849_15930 [Acidobacteria bacterium]|nr:hypothetical protein [Acidobacteriota bacterium]